MRISREFPHTELSNVISNIATALPKVGFQYWIYKEGEPQVVPEEERMAAVAELRQMGFAITIAQDVVRITKPGLPYWRLSQRSVRTHGIRWLSLVRKARGIRGTAEVLARSDLLLSGLSAGGNWPFRTPTKYRVGNPNFNIALKRRSSEYGFLL